MPEDFATRISPPRPRTFGRPSCFAQNRRRDRPCDHPRLGPRRVPALLRHRPRRARPQEHADDPEYIEWGDFSIVADGQPVAKHLHIAFYAPSHELVDAFHRAGVEAGYTDDGAPGPRPQYREDYYGGFLRDPDGNSVEAVYTGQERKTGAIDHLWLRTRDVAAIRRFYVGDAATRSASTSPTTSRSSPPAPRSRTSPASR